MRATKFPSWGGLWLGGRTHTWSIVRPSSSTTRGAYSKGAYLKGAYLKGAYSKGACQHSNKSIYYLMAQKSCPSVFLSFAIFASAEFLLFNLVIRF